MGPQEPSPLVPVSQEQDGFMWYAWCMRHESRTKLSALGSFMVVSVLAGLLVAGLAIPAATIAGVAATTINATLTELPEDLLAAPQAERTTLLLSDGSVMTQLFDENRIIVGLTEIAPIMRQAQIAIEDDRFYSHGALDMKSLFKAVVSSVASSDGGGGSTLTQQYVKQVRMENAMLITDPEDRQEALDIAQERSIKRKIEEARYAIGVERELSKDQILENYLNIAYYGDGAYGVEAAAHHYFNTTAANLTLAQAAMLAGIVQTPSRNPADPDELEDSIIRRNTVINRMLELGLITEDEATAAKAEGYDPSQIQSPLNGCPNADMAYIQVCEFIVKTLQANPSLGDSPSAISLNLKRNGYVIQTHIDPVMQQAAQNAISERIGDTDPVKSVMIEMQPGTGIVFAAAQNRRQIAFGNYTDSENLYAGRTSYQYFSPFGGAYDMDEGAQAGSTFKAFVLAAALNAGIPPSKMFNSPARMVFPARTDFKGCDGRPAVSQDPWTVNNSSRSGAMDMWTGTAQSVNTYYAQLERLVGVCASVTMAETVGVATNPNSPNEYKQIMDYSSVPAFTLGVADTSPMSMAVAYSTFAARGVRCDPVVVKSITDRDGQSVPTPNGNCRQVMRPEVADGVNAVLGNAFISGTAAGYPLPDRRPTSGKTGTTDRGEAVWLIGYTPHIVGVAMVSRDRNPAWTDFWLPRDGSMMGVQLSTGVTLNGFGAQDAGPIWRAAMSVATQYVPPDGFTAPTSEILKGKTVTMPKVDGMTKEQAKKVLEDAGFYVIEKQAYDDRPAGTYIGVSCEQVMGGTCSLLISQGPRPPEPGTQDQSAGQSEGPR